MLDEVSLSRSVPLMGEGKRRPSERFLQGTERRMNMTSGWILRVTALSMFLCLGVMLSFIGLGFGIFTYITSACSDRHNTRACYFVSFQKGNFTSVTYDTDSSGQWLYEPHYALFNGQVCYMNDNGRYSSFATAECAFNASKYTTYHEFELYQNSLCKLDTGWPIEQYTNSVTMFTVCSFAVSIQCVVAAYVLYTCKDGGR